MYTNLDGTQKEGGNFYNLLQEEGVREYPEREGGGFLQKKGVPALEETVAISELLDLVEVRAL